MWIALVVRWYGGGNASTTVGPPVSSALVRFFSVEASHRQCRASVETGRYSSRGSLSDQSHHRSTASQIHHRVQSLGVCRQLFFYQPLREVLSLLPSRLKHCVFVQSYTFIVGKTALLLVLSGLLLHADCMPNVRY